MRVAQSREPGEDTIAEPVFGFPVGTPVSRVLDTADLAARTDAGRDAAGE